MLFARRTVVAVVSVIGLVWTVSSFFGSLPKHVDVEHHVHAPREEQSLRGVRESPLESPLPAAPASPFPAAPVVCEFVQSNSSGLKGKSPVEDCADCNRGKCVTRESDGTFFVDCPFAVAKRNARARVFVFFPFGGERDTLMMHLMTLKDVVDYFIIAEGSETMSGKPKPLYLMDECKRADAMLCKLSKQIIYVPVELVATPDGWNREFFSRQVLINALRDYGIVQDDLIIITDTDEILRPEVVDFLARAVLPPRSNVRVMVRLWYFNYSWECLLYDWEIRVVRADFFDRAQRPRPENAERERKSGGDSVERARRDPRFGLQIDGPGGWHCSSCFPPEDILRKSRAHTEYLAFGQLNITVLKERMAQGKDQWGRPTISFVKVCPNDFPYMLKNLSAVSDEVVKQRVSNLIADRVSCK